MVYCQAMITYIYGLYDVLDETKTVQYVGKTTQLNGRLRAHKSSSEHHRPVRTWTKALIQSGSTPVITVLAQTEIEKHAHELEREWIARLAPIHNRQYAPPKSFIIVGSVSKVYERQNREILRLGLHYSPFGIAPVSRRNDPRPNSARIQRSARQRALWCLPKPSKCGNYRHGFNCNAPSSDQNPQDRHPNAKGNVRTVGKADN